jgi:DNA mismatch repair protein MutS
VIRRARDYLSRLDKFNAGGGPQADLFAPIGVAPETTTEQRAGARANTDADALAVQLASLDPDAMTPRDALAALYELRKLLR